MPQHDDLFEASKMSFGDHLEELRSALIKSIVAITVGFIIGLNVAGDFVRYITVPLEHAVENHMLKEARTEYIAKLEARRDAGEQLPDNLEALADLYVEARLAPRTVLVAPQQLTGEQVVPKPEELQPFTFYEYVKDDPRRVIATDVTQGFLVYVKAALVVGFVLASPFVFFFVWQFVAAGLYPHERSYVYIFLPFSLGLFLAGAAVAFFFALRLVLDFLFLFNEWLGVAPYPVINQWLGFILILPIGFGLSFQLPLVMLFLERIGIFTAQTYLAYWRIAVVVIFFISMILTPADPYSILLMAIPLTILYFGGILMCRFMPRRRTPFGDLVEP